MIWISKARSGFQFPWGLLWKCPSILGITEKESALVAGRTGARSLTDQARSSRITGAVPAGAAWSPWSGEAPAQRPATSVPREVHAGSKSCFSTRGGQMLNYLLVEMDGLGITNQSSWCPPRANTLESVLLKRARHWGALRLRGKTHTASNATERASLQRRRKVAVFWVSSASVCRWLEHKEPVRTVSITRDKRSQTRLLRCFQEPHLLPWTPFGDVRWLQGGRSPLDTVSLSKVSFRMGTTHNYH